MVLTGKARQNYDTTSYEAISIHLTDDATSYEITFNLVNIISNKHSFITLYFVSSYCLIGFTRRLLILHTTQRFKQSTGAEHRLVRLAIYLPILWAGARGLKTKETHSYVPIYAVRATASLRSCAEGDSSPSPSDSSESSNCL